MPAYCNKVLAARHVKHEYAFVLPSHHCRVFELLQPGKASRRPDRTHRCAQWLSIHFSLLGRTIT